MVDKKEVAWHLQEIFSNAGIDQPSNFQEIVDFCVEDVESASDPKNWHSGDVAIAFRRWMESKSE